MWRSYFTAALHNLVRNRAFAAINVFGLAIGFAAAILVVLYVRHEYGFDRAWPQAGRIYRLSTVLTGASRTVLATADERLGASLKLDEPGVGEVVRIWSENRFVKYGDTTLWSDFPVVDPAFLDLFPIATLAGDARSTLQLPDALLISRSFAQRLFGRTDVVDQQVEITGFRSGTFRIGAVLEDLPTDTHFAPFDLIASAVGNAPSPGRSAYTYLRVRNDVDVELIRDSLRGRAAREFSSLSTAPIRELELTALTDLHFQPSAVGEMRPSSDRNALRTFELIGLLTLVVAVSNFVSMMTARGVRRCVEVGVRKSVGATASQVASQFLVEGLLYAGIALIVAMGVVKILLPAFRSFVERDITIGVSRDAGLIGAVLVAWVVVAVAASAYPALVLSRLKPVAALRGGGQRSLNGSLRGVVVTLQFGLLIALMISTITLHRQTRFAVEEQLRVPGSQIYLMREACGNGVPFREIVRNLPGVESVACASTAAGSATFLLATGESVNMSSGGVEAAFFGIFGIAPLAGRLFDEQRGEDNVLRLPGATTNPSVVINESAARALGYANPLDAVGQIRRWSRKGFDADGHFGTLPVQASRIIGVVPDFTLETLRKAISPTAYYVDPRMSHLMWLKFDGSRIPETLRRVEAEWKESSGGRPIVGGRFLGDSIEAMYSDIRRQTQLFAVFACIAIVVAALGLLGLAIHTAECRTHEIGVRKCMGASRADILGFIGWQFARPVLIANGLAWLIAWLAMQRWLEGFAYHVELGSFAFLVSTAIALCIAVLTVLSHALAVSRARPVEALRYE